MGEDIVSKETQSWQERLQKLETLTPDQRECVEISCRSLELHDYERGLEEMTAFLADRGWYLEIIRKTRQEEGTVMILNRSVFSRDPENKGVRCVDVGVFTGEQKMQEIAHEFLWGSMWYGAKEQEGTNQLKYVSRRLKDVISAEKILAERLTLLPGEREGCLKRLGDKLGEIQDEERRNVVAENFLGRTEGKIVAG